VSTARVAARAVLAAGLLFSAGCRTQEPYDYTLYRSHMPRSILVLPPTNESMEVLGPYACLSTVSQPIAERGYYVFPVALVDAYMKENGCPTPTEMQSVAPAKLREHFGADAVLYLRVLSWGTSYQVINSSTSVSVEGRLVDLATETEIWTGTWQVARNSMQGQDNVIVMLLAAVIQQIADTTVDAAHDLAANTAEPWIASDHGLLPGPRHKDFGAATPK
jgi:hypothetical protein